MFVITRGYPTVWSLGSWGSFFSTDTWKDIKKNSCYHSLIHWIFNIYILFFRIFRISLFLVLDMFQLIEISVQNIFFPETIFNNFEKVSENNFLSDKLLKIRFWTSLKTTFLLNISRNKLFKRGSQPASKNKNTRGFLEQLALKTRFHVWPLKHMASGGLVGGLEHFFSIYWEFHNPNWRSHIFQRGRAQPPTRGILSWPLVVKTIVSIIPEEGYSPLRWLI